MNKIGILIPDASNSFFAAFSQAASETLLAHGDLPLILSCANDPKTETEILETLPSFCQGAICISGLDRLPQSLVDQNFPLVLADRKLANGQNCPWVGNDDREAMKLATQKLIDQGCKNIALLPGFIAQGKTDLRSQGYLEALEENGLPIHEEYILRRKGGRSSEEETIELVEKLLYDGKKIDGLIVSSDRSAFGAMKALENVGYYVPEDVRLIAFDNSVYAALASPAITALDRNPQKLAADACQALLARLDNQPAPEQMVTEVSLIIRDSIR